MSDEITEIARQQGELWSEGGRNWAELAAPLLTPVWSACLNCARITRGCRILDIGCGSGEALTLARLRGAEVAGIDPASDLLGIAQERVPDADLRRGDMVDLPYEDDAFDAALIINSLMFAGDRIKAIREARRVLTPDGRLGVAVWGEPDACEFRHVMKSMVDVLPEPPAGDGPFALSAPGVLKKVLERAEVEPVEEREIPTRFTCMDEEHYLQSALSGGPGQTVLRQVDKETVVDALLEAGEKFVQEDGAYHFENTFRVIAAIPEDN
ncbi:class I SAM-dependent methyltransferase [Natronorarus salvus]|uniref:class I SAM-dependent methyltransferase n=1 Tax=Natronorarus salvus TaxID=3117733 RepID=UPI002F26DAD6